MEISIKNINNYSQAEKQSSSKLLSEKFENIEYKTVQTEEKENFNKLPDRKEVIKQSNKVLGNQNNDQHAKFSKILFYMILLLSNILLNYLIKPIGTLLDFIFLSSIVFLPEIPTEKDVDPTQSINSFIRLIGWFIILILPMYNFYRIGIKIIVVHQSFFSKIYATIILSIEIILNIPFTFLYESNLYSIYLFEEDKYKQLLNPWLVFYPTNFTESIFEILRNFLQPGFFFVIAIIKYAAIKNSTTETFSLIILLIQIFACVMRFLGNLVITIKTLKEKVCFKDSKRK